MKQVIIAILVCTAIATQTDAQLRKAMEPRHFEMHAEALKLSGAEFDAARALFDDYAEEYAKSAEAMEWMWQWYNMPTEYHTMRVPTDLPVKDAPLTALREWSIEKLRRAAYDMDLEIDAAYFDRLRDLRPSSLADIDELERAWHREKYLPQSAGSLSGLVDLILLCDGALSGRSAPIGILEEWSRELDVLLLRYVRENARRNDYLAAVDKARRTDFDFTEAAELICRPFTTLVEILNLNEATLEKLAAALDEHDAAVLRQAYIEAKYPFIWKRSDETAIIETALKREGLADADRIALKALLDEAESLRQQYSRRLDVLQKDANDPEARVRSWRLTFEWSYGDRSGPRPSGDMQDSFQAAGAEFIEKMKAIGEQARTLLDQIEEGGV